MQLLKRPIQGRLQVLTNDEDIGKVVFQVAVKGNGRVVWMNLRMRPKAGRFQ